MLPTSLITEVNKRKIRDMSHELKKYGKKCNLHSQNLYSKLIFHLVKIK